MVWEKKGKQAEEKANQEMAGLMVVVVIASSPGRSSR